MPHPTSSRALTPSQRDVMAALIAEGIETGPVTIGVNTLAARAGLTGKQAEQALTQFANANTLSKTWDPDRYVWTYALAGTK